MRRWRIHQNRLPVIIDHAEIAAERGIARQWQYARVAPTSRVEERRGCFGRGHLSLGHFRGHLFFHAAGTVAVKSLVPSGDVAISKIRLCGHSAAPSRSGHSMRSRLSQRSEEHTSELQSLMRISYAVFCLKKKHKRTSTKQRCTRPTHQ